MGWCNRTCQVQKAVDLRRTAGSLLVDAGVHLECVADLLGHSSVATTRRHYVRAVRPTVPHAKQMDSVVN